MEKVIVLTRREEDGVKGKRVALFTDKMVDITEEFDSSLAGKKEANYCCIDLNGYGFSVCESFNEVMDLINGKTSRARLTVR